MNQNINLTDKILYSIITILIVSFFSYLLWGTPLIGEDIDQLFFSYKSFYDFYSTCDHGGVLSSFLMKFVGSFIPGFFNFHPNDNYIGIFIRSLNFAILFYLISRFVVVGYKEKNSGVICYFLAALMFFVYYIASYNSNILQTVFVYNRHFRYIFPMILYFGFWLILFRSILVNELPKGNKFLFFVLLSFCIGLSSEFVNISVLSSLVLLFVLVLGFFFAEKKFDFSVIKKSFLEKKSILNESFKYIFTFIAVAAGAAVFYSNPAFVRLANTRGISSPDDVIKTAVGYLPEFINSWFFEVFINDYHYFLTAGIIIFSILFGFLEKDKLKKIKVLSFSWILIFGVAVFNFSLLLSAKTYLNDFWVSCKSLNLETFLVLTTVFLFLLGNIFNLLFSLNKQMIVNISVFIFSVFLLCFSVQFLNYNDDWSLPSYKSELMTSRKAMYVAEKIYVLYANKGEEAKLPISLLKRPYIRDEIFGIGNYSNRIQPFVKPYYLSIYKKSKCVGVKFLPDEEALKAFYARGGEISYEEIKKSNFTSILYK